MAMPNVAFLLRNLIGVCGLLLSLSLSASSMQDSLHYKLGSEASVDDRLDAMLKLAERDLDTDPGTALTNYHRAVLYAENSGRMDAEHRALLALATVQDQLGLYAEHIGSVLRSLELAEAMGSVNALSDNLRQLALAYLHNGRTDKAVLEARKAVAMELPGRDQLRIIANEHVLITTLMANGQLDEALRTGRQILDRTASMARSREEMVTHLLMAAVGEG
jgi:tetratricopeptide (TPR) repeat protein